MSFVYRLVESIPKQLESGVAYHSKEFEVAALLCACGCGHRVMLLVPDSHQVFSQAGMATVRPSIAVCDAPCRSHFFITVGRVERLMPFSKSLATSVMRGQIARHAARDARPRSWIGRIRAMLARAYGKLKSILAKAR